MDYKYNKRYYPPKYSYDDLKLFTDGLSEENFIGRTQFCKVYRGKIKKGSNGTKVQEVTVKIWVVPKIYLATKNQNRVRVEDDIYILGHRAVNFHPNLVKLIGYCKEDEHFGVVYDLKSSDTLHNFILKDAFTWLQRIRVALGLACLLEFLHAKNSTYSPFLVRNLAAAHIMLDQDLTPKLIDFNMISGGTLYDWTTRDNTYLHGSYGYIDPLYATSGIWSNSCDVFAFGVILLSLITKRVYEPGEESILDEPFVYEWAESEYNSRKSQLGSNKSECSLVHESLQADECFFSSDGQKITELAMQCVEYDAHKRPTMDEVVNTFKNLRAATCDDDTQGIGQLLLAHHESFETRNLWSKEETCNLAY